MSQTDVYRFLKSNSDKWFTVREIAKNIGVNEGNVGRSMRSLVLDEDIRRDVKEGSGVYSRTQIFSYKRRRQSRSEAKDLYSS